jgi:hypothetical protein
MRAGSAASSGARHAIVAAGEALVVALIIATVLLVLSPLYRPAETLSGTTGVDAGGRGHITVPDGVFAGTTTATLNPGGSGTWAYAACYQNDTLVYAQYVKASGTTATFTLGPTPSWTFGAATCVAKEGYWGSNGRFRVIADTTFNVSG